VKEVLFLFVKRFCEKNFTEFFARVEKTVSDENGAIL